MTGANQPVARSLEPLLAVFWSTVTLFVALIALVFAQPLLPNPAAFMWYVFVPGVGVLAILGLVLVVLAARARLRRGLKISLLLTGISAIGMPAGVVLHNGVYALMITLFGPEFWGGGDEAVFFVLALFVFPVLLLVGAITGAVTLARARGDVWRPGRAS